MIAQELILKLADGIPGVMELLVQLLRIGETDVIYYFFENEIHGSGIWETYQITDKNFDEWLETLHRMMALNYRRTQ